MDGKSGLGGSGRKIDAEVIERRTVAVGDWGGDRDGVPYGYNGDKLGRVAGGGVGGGLSFKKSKAWGKDRNPHPVHGSNIEIRKGDREKGFDLLGRKKSLVDGFHMDVIVDEPFEGFGTSELDNVGSPGDVNFYVEKEG